MYLGGPTSLALIHATCGIRANQMGFIGEEGVTRDGEAIYDEC